MNIHYACKDLNNFGDLIGAYILNKLGYHSNWVMTDEKHVMLVGSILQDANENSTVIGAGFGARNQKTKVKNEDIKLVRGKITTELLLKQGYEKTWHEGDPALILPLIYNPSVDKKRKIGYLPHYIDKPLSNPFIDIQSGVENVINEILASEQIITSSLHGLIVAHTYGIPALLVKYSDKIAGDGMKYDDYFSTVGIEAYKPEWYKSNIDIPKNVGYYDKENLLEIIKKELENVSNFN